MDVNIVEKLLGIVQLGTEWVLWLLIAASVISVAIIIERILFFLRIRIDFRGFSSALTQKLLDNDVDGLQTMCSSTKSLEGEVVLRALAHREKGAGAMEQSMEGYLVGERQHLDRGLVVLGTLGNNAPFIGLFGTVIGIIRAFHELSLNPAGGPSVVMSGISEALIATAVGLMVAIPAVIAFNAFGRIVKRHMENAQAVMKMVLTHYKRTT